jgi:hypothetical protein
MGNNLHLRETEPQLKLQFHEEFGCLYEREDEKKYYDLNSVLQIISKVPFCYSARLFIEIIQPTTLAGPKIILNT